MGLFPYRFDKNRLLVHVSVNHCPTQSMFFFCSDSDIVFFLSPSVVLAKLMEEPWYIGVVRRRHRLFCFCGLKNVSWSIRLPQSSGTPGTMTFNPGHVSIDRKTAPFLHMINSEQSTSNDENAVVEFLLTSPSTNRMAMSTQGVPTGISLKPCTRATTHRITYYVHN